MSIKPLVYKKCLELVEQKIGISEKAMIDAQDSANTEEKSTAGDKHDTARAMSHIERDMYAKQLLEAVQLKKILLGVDISKSFDKIESGALVTASTGTYFISVALGKIDIKGKSIFAVSPVSPIGQLLLGKKKGQKFNFNGREMEVSKVI